MSVGPIAVLQWRFIIIRHFILHISKTVKTSVVRCIVNDL